MEVLRKTGNLTEADYTEAVRLSIEGGKVSPSYLQRIMLIGYNAACTLVERMECDGICSRANSAGVRQILRPLGAGPVGEMGRPENRRPNRSAG